MKKRALLIGILVLSCLLSGGPVRAQMPRSESAEDRQTLPEILKDTWETNPSLLSARAAQKALEEALPQAQAGWKPMVNADASVRRVDPAGSALDARTPKDLGLSVEQPLFRGGRTVAGIREANNAIRAGAARLKAAEQTILLTAARAYVDVVRDEALLALGEKNRDVIDRQLKATRSRFEVGDVTRTDVAQAQARLAQAQAAVVSARGALRASHAAFLQVTGRMPERLEKPSVSLDLPDTLDTAQSMAETASPMIEAARYDYRASDDAKDSVRGELLPQVAAFGDLTRSWDALEGTDGTGSAVGVRASVPLYEAGAVHARLREAGHTAQRKNMDLVAARRQAQEEIVTAWENLQTARAEIAARQAQVEAADLAREGVRQEADVGARTVLDALDADQEALDAQVALVTARRNEIVAQFTLAAALGLLAPSSFGDSSKDDRSE